MRRRSFLQAGAASLASIAPWPMAVKQKTTRKPPPAKGIRHFGPAQPFSFEQLKARAHAMSLTVYD